MNCGGRAGWLVDPGRVEYVSKETLVLGSAKRVCGVAELRDRGEMY